MKQSFSEFVEITYAPEYNAIIIIWKKQVTDEVYKSTYNTLLSMLKTNKADAFVSDTYKQGIVSAANRQWMLEHIMPEAVYNGLKRIAVISNEETLKKMHTDEVRNSTLSYSAHIDIQYFKNMNDAFIWIKNKA